MSSEDCCSPTQSKIANIFGLTTAIISTTAVLPPVLSYILIPKLRNSISLRFIGFLMFSNLLYGIGAIAEVWFMLLGIEESKTLTVFLFLGLIGNYASIIWSICIGITILSIILARVDLIHKLEYLIIIMSFGIPIIITYMWYRVNSLSAIQEINPSNSTLFVYIPSFIAFSLIMILTFMVRKPLKSAFGKILPRALLIQLMCYPLILLVTIGIAVIEQILLNNNNCQTFIILMIHYLRNIQGLIDAIVFGFNPTFRKEVQRQKSEANEKSPLEAFLPINDTSFLGDNNSKSSLEVDMDV